MSKYSKYTHFFVAFITLSALGFIFNSDNYAVAQTPDLSSVNDIINRSGEASAEDIQRLGELNRMISDLMRILVTASQGLTGIAGSLFNSSSPQGGTFGLPSTVIPGPGPVGSGSTGGLPGTGGTQTSSCPPAPTGTVAINNPHTNGLPTGKFWYQGLIYPNQTFAIRFTASPDTTYPTRTGEFRIGSETPHWGSSYYASSISKCPGDFSDANLASTPDVNRCRNWNIMGQGNQMSGPDLPYAISGGGTPAQSFCDLEEGEIYYLNISTDPRIHPDARCIPTEASAAVPNPPSGCSIYVQDVRF